MFGAMVVAQLVGWLLLSPNLHGSNPEISINFSNTNFNMFVVKKRKGERGKNRYNLKMIFCALDNQKNLARPVFTLGYNYMMLLLFP